MKLQVHSTPNDLSYIRGKNTTTRNQEQVGNVDLSQNKNLTNPLKTHSNQNSSPKNNTQLSKSEQQELEKRKSEIVKSEVTRQLTSQQPVNMLSVDRLTIINKDLTGNAMPYGVKLT